MPTTFNANKAFRAVFLGDPARINTANMKDDLILGRTVYDRVFDLVVFGGQKRFNVGWWVTSKNCLLHDASDAGKIVKLLNKVNKKSAEMVTILEDLLDHRLAYFLSNTGGKELLSYWIIDEATKDKIVTVMLSKSKVMHWMDGFIDRCEDFANGASDRRRKKYMVSDEDLDEKNDEDLDEKNDEDLDEKNDEDLDEKNDEDLDEKNDENLDEKNDENPD